MRRWLFAIASTLSLLLCIASAVLWVRSYTFVDGVERYVEQFYDVADWDVNDKVLSFKGLILWVHVIV